MNKTVYAVSLERGIVSLGLNELSNYLIAQYYPSSTPEQVEKMLNTYTVTIASFPIRHGAGKHLGKADKTLETLTEDRVLDKALYYLVSPAVVRSLVVEET